MDIIYQCRTKTNKKHPNEKIIIYETNEMTIRDLSKISNIDYYLLLDRISSKGKTPEEAVALGVSRKKKYFYKGEYLSLTDIARKSGISWGVLRYRVMVKGESFETATSY